jgi:hypothetical protein
MEEELYRQMMNWALGKDWELSEIKKAPQIFNERHSDLCRLETIAGSSTLLRTSYYVFQMTILWMKHFDPNINQKNTCEKALSEYREEQNKGYLAKLLSYLKGGK